MNRDDITRMAREAGFNEFNDGLRDDGSRDTYLDCWPENLERFAALVVEHYKDECERELTEAIKEMQERGLGQ